MPRAGPALAGIAARQSVQWRLPASFSRPQRRATDTRGSGSGALRLRPARLPPGRAAPGRPAHDPSSAHRRRLQVAAGLPAAVSPPAPFIHPSPAARAAKCHGQSLTGRAARWRAAVARKTSQPSSTSVQIAQRQRCQQAVRRVHLAAAHNFAHLVHRDVGNDLDPFADVARPGLRVALTVDREEKVKLPRKESHGAEGQPPVSASQGKRDRRARRAPDRRRDLPGSWSTCRP
jgi:hypothetical protein